MSSALWLDIFVKAESAADHFAKAVALFREGGFDAPGLAGYRARMAFLHAMQCGFGAAESALRATMELLEEEPPRGGDAHARLIDRATTPIRVSALSRPAILPPEMAADLHEARRFRRVAVHAYDFFEPSLAQRAVAAAERLARRFPEALRRFRAAIDPEPGEDGPAPG